MNHVEVMATERLNDLKCRDCCKCDNVGREQHFCDQTALPIDANGPACISVLQKVELKNGYQDITRKKNTRE